MTNEEQKVFDILDKSFNNHWNSTTDLIKESVAKEIVKLCNLHFVSNSEADCKYKNSCGLFPCNLTECDEYEPEESEAAVCRYWSSCYRPEKMKYDKLCINKCTQFRQTDC